MEALQDFTKQLHLQFALKDLGPIHYFLGIHIHITQEGFHLNQSKYVSNLLSKFNMEKSTTCPTPIAVGNSLSKHDSELLLDHFTYKSVVGGLQYLTHTRLDISFARIKLSQFLQHPTSYQASL